MQNQPDYIKIDDHLINLNQYNYMFRDNNAICFKGNSGTVCVELKSAKDAIKKFNTICRNIPTCIDSDKEKTLTE